MGRGKQNRNSSHRNGPLLLDRNITPRIAEYALNHDISDVDDVVEYLRRNYKEYQRRQVATLKHMVVRALQVVQPSQLAKPELQLQVRSAHTCVKMFSISPRGWRSCQHCVEPCIYGTQHSHAGCVALMSSWMHIYT